MSKENILTKKALIIIGLLWLLIFSIGLVLALYFNESFYNDNSIIWTIFYIITYLGDSIVLIIIMGILYIGYDKKYALHLVYCVLTSVYINSIIKDIFKNPRPPTNNIAIEEDYGFPSGHSQTSVASYGYIANGFKDKRLLRISIMPILCSIVIFLVAISRIIIGVHDVQDIIGGLLIGIVLLIGIIYLEPIISEKVKLLNLPTKVLISIIISILLFTFGIIFSPTAGMGEIDGAIPYSDSGGYALVSGAFLGLSIGYILENKYIKYDPSELNSKQKRINLIIELVILIPLFFILEFALGFSVITRFIRYAILAFVLVFIGPLLFKKIDSK